MIAPAGSAASGRRRGGPSAAELPGDPQPGWAAFLAAAVAAAPLAPVVPAGELPGTSGFRFVLAPFTELAATRLPVAVPDAELPLLRAEFTDRLARKLAGQAARALVLELNVARAEGRLAGDTPAARFRTFLSLTARQDGLSALLSEYPVLGRLLAQTCVDAADALTELLDHYTADRAELLRALLPGTDPGPLVSLRAAAGDGHRHGRSTAVLTFADGSRVVHKPRPLTAHRHFNELVGWFNGQPDVPELRTVALLERPGYGWLAHVAALPCRDRGQLELFYRRQGAWLALLHALDATDLHYENLIARADHPVPVDVETLFHPPVSGSAPGGDPAALALAASVHRVGLLPLLLFGEDGTVLDASGLGGDTGAATPLPVAAWAESGTDRMRLVRRAGTIAGADNRPRLDGAQADPAEFTEALVAGFRAGYRAIAAGREALTGPQGLVHRFAEDEVRVVPRATQAYATLLDESTHPDVLRDPADRDELLRLLGTDALGAPGPARLLEHEVAQLWDGDVPLFTARPGLADLWSGPGLRIPDALERPGLARVVEKIRAMGPADLDAQEWIVRAALAARSTAPAHRPDDAPAAGRSDLTGAEPTGADRTGADRTGRPARERTTAERPTAERLLGAARRIGDRLVEGAHRGRGRANWLGLELLGDRAWRFGPAGADLGHGYPGPALFLAELAAHTGEQRYADTARQALSPLPALLERLAAEPEDLAAVGPGAFAGLGGIAYVLARAAVLLDDPESADWADRAAELTAAAVEFDHTDADADAEARADGWAGVTEGVAEGTAGGLAALLAVHATTGSAAARRGAVLCAERLADRPLPAAPGFAEGAAGVGWALLRFAAACGGERYGRAGLAALRRAARGVQNVQGVQSVRGVQNVQDVQGVRGAAGVDLAWCRGLSGVALAVADSPAALADPELAGLVGRAVRASAAAGPLSGHAPCHGESGVLELLGRLADPGGRELLDRRAGALAAALDRVGPVCSAPGGLAVPGLLTGLSGIGLGLLRLGSAGRTVSTLLLQPSPSVRPSGTDGATITERNVHS
ncbi:type 2 lantibiotic biosynthesis protein LanM [Kitasatospora cineracea]|uniref:Type 2 lantibiotic biosynthesis protein LanM n=1 Tax=Kitasatospora cineracea TaxID=88074 RepID=A0A8G1U9G0_9ACTN|nr:type 2 lantibiotic biosynthesis protein LanM [Kitasatospora cineracea]